MEITYSVADALNDLKRLDSFKESFEGDAVVQLKMPNLYPLAIPTFIKSSEELDSRTEMIVNRKLAGVGPVYCARVHNATLLSNSVILTEEKKFLGDLAHIAARNHPYPGIKSDKQGNKVVSFPEVATQYIDECAGLLFFHPCCGQNHSHWLIQTIVKLGMFRDAGMRPNKLIVQPNIKRYQKEMLAMLGYPESDLLIRDINQPMCFRELYATYTGMSLPPDLSLFDEMMAQVEPQKGLPERIYVSRQDTPVIRRFLNEDRIIDLVQEYGFEIVIPSRLTVEEEINIFRNAKIIVGPLGAGLYNSIFNDSDANIIALSDSCYMMEWATQIAGLRKHKIGLVFGNSFWSYTEGAYWGTHNNYIVDPVLVREAIESVL